MQNDKVWRLIARKLAGEASQDEVSELERLRKENHHINYYIQILSAWWILAERDGKDEAEQAFETLLKKFEKKNTIVKRQKRPSSNQKKLYRVARQ